MGWLIGALIGLTLGGIGAIASGYAQNEKDKQQRDAYELQLEQEKKSNAINAINTASQKQLDNFETENSIDRMMNDYNNQLKALSEQSTLSLGQAKAKSASTGFRNNGSNSNLEASVERQNRYQINSATSSMMNNLISSGYNNMQNQSSVSNALQGYRLNIDNAIATTRMNVNNLGVAENYWGSGRSWGDFGLGALNGTVNFVGSNANSIGTDIANWIHK